MKLKQKKSSTYISGLPWVLPALIFLIIIIYYSIFYTFELSTLDWNGLDPLRKNIRRMVGKADNVISVLYCLKNIFLVCA